MRDLYRIREAAFSGVVHHDSTSFYDKLSSWKSLSWSPLSEREAQKKAMIYRPLQFGLWFPLSLTRFQWKKKWNCLENKGERSRRKGKERGRWGYLQIMRRKNVKLPAYENLVFRNGVSQEQLEREMRYMWPKYIVYVY